MKNSTTIIRIAVREAVASQYHVGQLWAPPETSCKLLQYGNEGFKGSPQLGPPYTDVQFPV